MLVWARPGPRADAQAQWTAAIARGLDTEVSLVDVIESSKNLSDSGGSRAEEELQDHIEKRMEGLRRHVHAEFADMPADCRVRVAASAETDIIESAASERRDTVVLWGPVQERMIRALLQKTPCTVLVIRCPRLRPGLPWTVAVADGDEAALRVAKALVRGSQEESSLHVEPAIDPGKPDDVPGQVVCVSRPMPGWWSSHVFRRHRPVTTSKGAVIEIYDHSSMES